MHPLEGQSLLNFHEHLHHIRYILIDAMSFIKQKVFFFIDECLREAFPSKKNTRFRNHSIILVGDLGQLPTVEDFLLYVGKSHGNALYRSFNTFITLYTIFCQQGESRSQVSFHQLLPNLKSGMPTQEDWNLLISRKDTYLLHEEHQVFEYSMHL